MLRVDAWRIIVFVVWSAKNNCTIARKWPQVFINHNPESSALACRRECELCGYIHERSIVDSYSVQQMR